MGVTQLMRSNMLSDCCVELQYDQCIERYRWRHVVVPGRLTQLNHCHAETIVVGVLLIKIIS